MEMIKIDTTRFDTKKIDEFYKDIVDKVIARFKNYAASGGNEELKKKFLNNFGDGIEINEEKLTEYFTNAKRSRIKEIINEFKPNCGKIDNCVYKILLIFNDLSPNIKTKNIIQYVNKKIESGDDEVDVMFVERCNSFFMGKGDEKLTKDMKNFFIKSYYLEYATSIDINHEIEQFLSYDMISNRRNELVSAMKMDICPYCNRQFITNWCSTSDKGKQYSTADLDHYYLKSLYPIASLCLYNLIPSCQICNSRFKLTHDFFDKDYIYPYEECFDSEEHLTQFEFANLNLLIDSKPKNDIYSSASDDFEFKLVNKKNSLAVENSIKVFHLNEVYNSSHIDYVEELVKRAQIYNASQVDEYLQNYQGMFANREEVLRIIFGNYINQKDFGKRPLAKLTKDLLEDLGITLK